MLLLTIAHKGEAAKFIKRKHNLEVDFHFKGLYRHGDELLLLTRQGMQATAERIEAVLSYFGKKINLVINLGIAGSLGPDLQINQVYAIRCVLHESYPEEKGKIYTTQERRSKLDCISVEGAVENNKKAQELLRYAQIVDMELWAVADGCNRYEIPFRSYKLISDFAGAANKIVDIRAEVNTYSKHLFDFYKKLPF